MHEYLNTLKKAGRIGVTELAERVDRPASVTHDYLSTLHQLGYVTKVDRKYQLSLRYLEIGSTVRDRIPLYHIARHDIKQLAQESRSEMVSIIIEENGLCIALDVTQSSQSIDYETFPGMHFYMHSSGVGKAMLAHYSEGRVHEILDQHGMLAKTENTITNRDELFEELGEIRKAGVAFEREEYKLRMQSIAAPIMDSNDEVVGGLSVSGPAHRLREPSVQRELKDSLLSTVNVIELNYPS
jgi:IclR family transcriptional regulator, acetate operon repressor